MESNKAAAFFIVNLLAVVFIAWAVSQHYSSEALHRQIEGCERTKLDRIDNARAWTAQSKYLSKVLAAKSVKGDVKAAATQAIQKESESANQLRTRLLECEPLIKHNKRVIDEHMLKEALGEL